MKRVEGKHKCFVCNNEFSWSGVIKDGEYIETRTTSRGVAEAKIYATGSVATSTGKKTTFEVVASCTYCNNDNKFEV